MFSEDKLLSFVSNRSLELIILPTEQCNFRCTYCYEDFTIGKMSRQIVNAIKKLLSKRMPDLEILKLSWFGGEPLVAKDVLFEISEYVKKMLLHYPHVKYVGGITTNASTLNESTLSRLIELNINEFQISLDGTQQEHDKTRVRMDGSGTFSKIWQNLISAKESDHAFKIIIRIHITPDNLNDIYALTDMVKVTFGGDSRFRVFYKAIENLGGSNSGSFKTIHGKDKADILKSLYDYLGQDLLGAKIDQDGPYVCYAARPNSIVIRANGKIGKCTVAFNDARNDLGQLNEDGTLSIDSDKLSLWTRGFKEMDEKALHCPMSNMPKIISKLQAILVSVEH